MKLVLSRKGFDSGSGGCPSPVLAFDARRQLTAPGAASPPLWSLPAWFLPADGRPDLSYHQAPKRWTRDGERVRVQTVSRGQEFVLDCESYPQARPWLRSILTSASIPPPVG